MSHSKSISRRTGIISFILLSGCLKAFAQQDSVSAISYAIDSVYAFERGYIRAHPVWINQWKDNFNKLELNTSFAKGKFVPSQGSTQTRAYQFDTEGKTTWKGVHLYGRFDYTKSFEDSTRLRHQTRVNETAPVYFGSIRYNHYERSVYQLHAVLQKDLQKENLPFTLGVDYRLGQHFSNNDPRSAINDFQLTLLTALGYRKERWEYHVDGKYGYGRERIQVSYKNEKYTQNLADSLYVNWLMNGYGNAYEKIKEIHYNDDMRRYGIGLHTKFLPHPNSSWRADIEWLHETQAFKQYVTAASLYTLFNDYIQNQWKVAVFWHRQLSDGKHMGWSAEALFIDGADEHPDFGVNNYLYKRAYVTTEWKMRNRNWQYSSKLGYDRLQQQDGNAGVNSQTSNLNLEAAISRRFDIRTQRFLQVQGRLGYCFPLDASLDFPPINETIFTSHIIYHDYLYRHSASWIAGTSIAYFFPSKQERLTWSVSLSANYQQRSDLPDYPFQPPSIPGKNRWNSLLRLLLFF